MHLSLEENIVNGKKNTNPKQYEKKMFDFSTSNSDILFFHFRPVMD
jgi:hypothetical protein